MSAPHGPGIEDEVDVFVVIEEAVGHRDRRSGIRAGADAGTAVAVADSLFDHNEDIDFILDPGTVRRGHVRPGPPRTTNVQGEHAVITF